MNKNILFFILLSFLNSTEIFAQVYKSKAKEVAFRSKIGYDNWPDWGEWEKCDILVVLSIDKNTFTLYSKEIQEFDIIEYFEKEKDRQGNEIFKMLCVDKNGLRCHIRQRFTENGYYYSQLYIEYADFMYVYNLLQKE